jgi:hypothetical protein
MREREAVVREREAEMLTRERLERDMGSRSRCEPASPQYELIREREARSNVREERLVLAEMLMPLQKLAGPLEQLVNRGMQPALPPIMISAPQMPQSSASGPLQAMPATAADGHASHSSDDPLDAANVPHVLRQFQETHQLVTVDDC